MLGILSSLMLAVPAQAARLQFWRFDPDDNVLTFTTDTGVQPRAQLIPNPSRIVIDLPGIILGSSMLSQQYRGAVREVRIGQFDSETTRIVIELNPGYTVDPQQVRVRGATPTQWTVELPTPQRIAVTPPTSESAPPSSTAPLTNTPPVAGAATQLENVRITPDGFFVRLSGAAPDIEVGRSRDRRQVNIDIANATIAAQLVERDQEVNLRGVTRFQVIQAETSPPVVRITLDVSDESADWQATVSNLGGIVIVPTGGTGSTAVAEREDEDEDEEETPPSLTPAQPATIQAIELSSDGRQLMIRADRPVNYTSGWDRSTGAYRISIPAARLAEQVTGPQLAANSPLLNVRLREEADRGVTILAQPAAGVRIDGVSQPNNQLVSLALDRSSQAIPITPSTPIPNTPISPGELPQVPNSRIVIVVDPGHGGPDPGAIGIGGLREKDIVLPVALQVAALLEQQGVTAVLTRSDDRDLDLEPRVQIAERANANLFVSIHANAINLSRPDINGIETYYYSDSGLQLARVIHSSMVQVPGTQDRGIRQARFYVIRNTSMPAVLLELGFVTGAQDARLLADPTFQSQMAAAIARGILQYVQQNF
jgi:N-acetylmuramoyl-L-alanine amidase